MNMQIRLGRTSCSSSSSRSSLGSFLRMNAVHETEGELSQEHAELDDDIDKESRCRSRRSLSRPLWLWSPGLNLISSKQSVSLSSDDVVTYIARSSAKKERNDFDTWFQTRLKVNGTRKAISKNFLLLDVDTHLHFNWWFELCVGGASGRCPRNRRPEEIPGCCI